MSIDGILDGAPDDLEALMARVREAAGVVDAASAPAPAADGTGGAAESDLAQALAAQAAWNERMTRSLALIVECLQGLQEAFHELESNARRRADRTAPRSNRGGRPTGPSRSRQARGNGRSK